MKWDTRHLGTAALVLYALSMLLPAAELRYNAESSPQTVVGFFMLGLSLLGFPMLFQREPMGYVCLLGVCCNVLFIAGYLYFAVGRRVALAAAFALLAAVGAVIVAQLNLQLKVWGFGAWLLSFGFLAIAAAGEVWGKLRGTLDVERPAALPVS
jgi:hypothetical protein